MKISRRRLADYVKKNCSKKRAARAVRLFSLVQPVKALICGIFVAVVIFKLPKSGYEVAGKGESS